MKTTLTAIALSIAALTTQAQQTTTITGDDGRSEQQNIGDTDASNNHTNSTSTQLGNSANANGATITTGVDTDVRNQNTVNSAGGAATGGAAASGQLQQLVQRVTVMECVMAQAVPAAPVQVIQRIIPQPPTTAG